MSEHTSSPLNHPNQLDAMDHLDPEFVSIASKLDELAHHERSLPDTGFEARVLAHVESAKLAPKLVLVGASEDTPPAMTSRGSGTSGHLFGMRLAAAVAIISGVGTVWIATRAPSTSQNPIANSGSQTSGVTESHNNSYVPDTEIATASIDDGDLLLSVAFGDESVEDLQDLRDVTESLEVSIHSRLDVHEYFSDKGAT